MSAVFWQLISGGLLSGCARHPTIFTFTIQAKDYQRFIGSRQRSRTANSTARARVAWVGAGYCLFRESSVSSIPGTPDRSLADDVEAVFVLVAFRRFAQFSGNQRQGADSGDEKACGEHDVNQARFAPIVQSFRLFRTNKRFRVVQSGIVPVGDAWRKLTRATDEFLSAACASPSSISAISQIFGICLAPMAAV